MSHGFKMNILNAFKMNKKTEHLDLDDVGGLLC